MKSANSVLLVVLFIVIGVSESGCTSTLHLYRSQRAAAMPEAGEAVFVTNPELSREFSILQRSGIYTLAQNPEGARRLTLRPIVQHFRCANPLIPAIFTLGLLPGFLPAAMDFEYDLETGGASRRLRHQLPLYERYSIWERFSKQDGDQMIGEALRRSPRVIAPSGPDA